MRAAYGGLGINIFIILEGKLLSAFYSCFKMKLSEGSALEVVSAEQSKQQKQVKKEMRFGRQRRRFWLYLSTNTNYFKCYMGG